MKHPVSLTVNGAKETAEVEPRLLLVHYLRDNLQLTGTNVGCDTSQCGACTVLLDGAVVDSCLVPLSHVDGHAVRTVEGLAPPRSDPAGPASPDELNVLQRAFLETGGAQCGICTPGMLMAGEAFLASGVPASDAAIREAIAGNLCRCTGYTKIIEAIALAADRRSGGAQA